MCSITEQVLHQYTHHKTTLSTHLLIRDKLMGWQTTDCEETEYCKHLYGLDIT